MDVNLIGIRATVASPQPHPNLLLEKEKEQAKLSLISEERGG
jgi:hypothetical protein